eukprot:SAG31_NODE_1348_length_8693_cov_4.345008_8_plen_57_part_00
MAVMMTPAEAENTYKLLARETHAEAEKCSIRGVRKRGCCPRTLVMLSAYFITRETT